MWAGIAACRTRVFGYYDYTSVAEPQEENDPPYAEESPLTNSGANPYRLLVDSLPDALILADKAGQCVDANGAALDLLGYQRKEMIGHPVITVIPSWSPQAERSWKDADVTRKDGMCVPVLIWATEIPQADDTNGIIAVFLRPATDRRDEDAAWARMAAIVTSSSEAIIGTTLDGVITSWNPAAERLYGYSTAEAIGQSVKMLTPSDLTVDLAKLLAQVRRGDIVKEHETVRQTSDGRRIDVSLAISPVRDSSGEIIAFSAVARDITEFRVQRQEMSRLAAIVESSDEAIISKTLDGTITSWNRAAERLYGYTGREAVGQSIAMLVPTGEFNDTTDLLRRVTQGERIEGYEARRQTKDGRILDVALTVSPVHDSNGVIVGASAISRDVTELRRLQEERDRLHSELEAEFQRAAVIQAQLLPHAAPDLPGYEFVGVYLPARLVGGDFFDWLAGDDAIRLSLADVMGKGMSASLLTATARAALRAVQQLPVSTAAETVNRILAPDLMQSDSFITLFYADLNTATGALSYIDAGHGMAFIQRRAGDVEPLRQRGLPLGVLPDAIYPAGTTTLEPGDTLVVYSDGLPDARPELRLDAVGVAGQIGELPDAQAKLERLVGLAMEGETRPDDLTLVLVSRREEASLGALAPLTRGSFSR